MFTNNLFLGLNTEIAYEESGTMSLVGGGGRSAQRLGYSHVTFQYISCEIVRSRTLTDFSECLLDFSQLDNFHQIFLRD